MTKRLFTGIFAILLASSFATTAHARISCRTICRAFLAGVGIQLQRTAFQTEGVGVFDDNSPADQKYSVLQPSTWVGDGDEPTLGHVRWEFDVSRPVQNSSVIPNQEASFFPATGDLYFHIVGTVGFTGDTKYQSVEPLHVQSFNLFSFDPANGEQFVLVAPVDFVDASNPDGGVAFTLSDLVLEVHPG